MAEIEIGSSTWDSSFIGHLSANLLGSDGFSIYQGSQQYEPLPWTNLDRVFVRFTQDVQVDAADLALTGTNATQYAFSGFHYDPQTQVASWTLSDPLEDDRLHLELNAVGVDPIANLSGDTLATAGTNFTYSFSTNPGDVLRDGVVDYTDWYTEYYYSYYGGGYTVSDPGYLHFYDVDGSGVIDADEHALVYAQIGMQVPSAAPAGATNSAPSAMSSGYLPIDNDAVDHTFSLHSLFDDIEDSDSDLTYSVTSNSAPGLFDSVGIDAASGALLLNSASGMTGRAEIVISATDSGGLSVMSTVAIDVNRANLPPTIIFFIATPTAANTWVVGGQISDADEDPAGWFVEISGAIHERAVVDETGVFVFSLILDPSVYGPIVLTVTDSQGAAVTASEQIGYS